MHAIVIGAGLSGLAAAHRLVHGGFTVTLIEARNRIGGRVFASHVNGMAIELGAEWVGNSGIVHDLLRGAGARVAEVDGRYLRRAPDGYRNAWDPEDRSQSVLKRALSLDGPDRSLQAALRTLGIGDAEAAAALRYVEGFHAADPDQVGIHWLREVEETQSAAESSFRCENGLDRVLRVLSDGMGTSCDTRLGVVARGVRWGSYGAEVDIETERGKETLSARAVVVSVPVTALKTLSIEPSVAGRSHAAALMRMGDVAKVVLQTSDRFWDNDPRLKDMAFLFATEAEFPTIWTASAGSPGLIAWAGGPRATRLCAMSDAEIVSRAVGSVAYAMSMDPADVERHVIAAYFHNWTRDPHSLGAYTYVGVGGVRAHEVLARPISDAIYFAGEATIGGGYNATMEGAVRSGIRAADELIAAHAGSPPIART